MKKTKNQTGGAMILNLIVGISIFAMLSLLSIPYVKKYQTSMILSGTVKNLTADLRFAQQSTITEQVVHIVQLDEIGNNYSILKTGAATTTIKTVNLPAGISYQSISADLNGQVIFNSFGGVSQSGSIIIKNEDNRTNAINIKPSGYIQMTQ